MHPIEIIFIPGSWLSLTLLVVGAVLLLVCVALWIAVCAHVIPEDGNESKHDQVPKCSSHINNSSIILLQILVIHHGSQVEMVSSFQPMHSQIWVSLFWLFLLSCSVLLALDHVSICGTLILKSVSVKATTHADFAPRPLEGRGHPPLVKLL